VDLLESEELAALGDVRPEEDEGLVLSRRVFADGRTRAYAWGRAVAREDVAAAAERLIAMSGQFEQRRLARPSYQLDVLDGFCGEDSCDGGRARAWRELRPPGGPEELGRRRRARCVVEELRSSPRHRGIEPDRRRSDERSGPRAEFRRRGGGGGGFAPRSEFPGAPSSPRGQRLARGRALAASRSAGGNLRTPARLRDLHGAARFSGALRRTGRLEAVEELPHRRREAPLRAI
jgi:hypothetical protein